VRDTIAYVEEVIKKALLICIVILFGLLVFAFTGLIAGAVIFEKFGWL
jgi:hypothetical protein